MIDMRKAERKLLDTVREWVEEHPEEYNSLINNKLQSADNESNKK